MSTPFEQKRLGRTIMSEAFVTTCRAKEVFDNFAVLLAHPTDDSQYLITYYGAHPDFDPYEGEPKDAPLYQPYWNDIGMYFQREKR